jgi:hypothetical protein
MQGSDNAIFWTRSGHHRKISSVVSVRDVVHPVFFRVWLVSLATIRVVEFAALHFPHNDKQG